jgi:hypothetical protein
MNLNFFKSEPKLAFPRCEHRSPAGRQCSQPVCTTDPRFCGTHKPTPEQPCPESSRRVASAELAQAAGTLDSPEDVHRLLKAVTLVRIRGLISPKEAGVYSYLCQTLLRAHRELAYHQELQSERDERSRPPRESKWNVPSGIRTDPPDPAPAESRVAQQPAISSENVRAGVPALSLTEGARLPLPAETVTATAEPNSAISVAKKSPAASSLNASTPLNSSTSSPNSSTPLNSSTSFSPPPDFYNHFYPIDPSIPPDKQDKSKNIPPPDEAECRRLAARRGLLFNRRRPAYPGAHR